MWRARVGTPQCAVKDDTVQPADWNPAPDSKDQQENGSASSTTPTPTAVDKDSGNTPVLACPVCHTPLSVMANSLVCRACGGREYPKIAGSGAVDLTVFAGIADEYTEQRSGGVTTFQNPLVSFAYERGWRESFAWAGFPGASKEFEDASNFLRARGADGPDASVLDMSCGSGLFTRRFAASGDFGNVVAADFSDSMLDQAKTFLDDELGSKGEVRDRVRLVRCDVARLPFENGTFDAVHAGAALHCWPSPSAAMVEISRVLRPGGVFVATTFLDQVAPLGQIFGDDVVNPISRAARAQNAGRLPYRWWSEKELRELMAMAGLENISINRDRQYIMIAASRPI